MSGTAEPTPDPILAALNDAHAALVAAGKAYVGGDKARALDELEGVAVVVVDAVADLRRDVGAEQKVGA